VKHERLPEAPGVDVWALLDRHQQRGECVILNPGQVRVLLAERARLVEKANERTREGWAEESV
jgi:hypothetical protein